MYHSIPIHAGPVLNRQEMENATHTTEMPWWDELDQQMAGGEIIVLRNLLDSVVHLRL